MKKLKFQTAKPLSSSRNIATRSVSLRAFPNLNVKEEEADARTVGAPARVHAHLTSPAPRIECFHARQLCDSPSRVTPFFSFVDCHKLSPHTHKKARPVPGHATWSPPLIRDMRAPTPQ